MLLDYNFRTRNVLIPINVDSIICRTRWETAGILTWHCLYSLGAKDTHTKKWNSVGLSKLQVNPLRIGFVSTHNRMHVLYHIYIKHPYLGTVKVTNLFDDWLLCLRSGVQILVIFL